MAKRMSNSDRIRQKAAEAAAAEKEKTEKKKKTATKKKAAKKKKTTTRKKVTKAAKRLKIVWSVFDESYNEVASFPYPDKNKAETKAKELAKKKDKKFLVRAVRVPMEDE